MDYSSEDSQANKPRPKHEHEASTTELLANAQLLAGVAFNQKGADKAKLSEAAEEMIAAGEDYGNLGEGSYGAYIEKAEGFLHKYHAPESDTGTGNPTADKTERAARPAKYDLEEESDMSRRPEKYDLEVESDMSRRAARPAKYELEDESDMARRPDKYDLEVESDMSRRAARPAKYELEDESDMARRPDKYDLEVESDMSRRAARPAKYDLEEESDMSRRAL